MNIMGGSIESYILIVILENRANVSLIDIGTPFCVQEDENRKRLIISH